MNFGSFSAALTTWAREMKAQLLTLWISRSHIRTKLETKHHDYAKIRDELLDRGVLLDAAAKKVLGAGTEWTGGQTTCWRITTNHPDLVGVV